MNGDRVELLQTEASELKAEIAKIENEAQGFWMMVKACESKVAHLTTQLRDVQINLAEAKEPSVAEGDR